jgi:SAM-dependent methyltransferase
MWTRCRSGHIRHDHQLMTTSRGLHRGLDLPDRRMMIYDSRRYMDRYDTYCPGQDIISYEIDRTGMWEQAETRLFVDLLRHSDAGVVLDLGCHIGWYATIADMLGFDVIGVDASPENVELARWNVGHPDAIHLGVIDGTVPPLPVLDIAVAKIDIEGAEQHAVNMLAPALEARTVEYVLMEISPVFNDSYPKIMHQMAEWGYEAYEIPLAATPEVDLPHVRAAGRITEVDVWLATIDQTDVLFMPKEPV